MIIQCYLFIDRNSDCGWNITTTSNQSVEVVVYFLDIDDSDDCLNRRLEINTNGMYVLLFFIHNYPDMCFDFS